ncbi:MAG: type II toxin-antitoxin system CcdA family antitoxin [Deltaproteobacteria bacterium]|nr:type II toxin-antitoxin system CcdA family antitoxin [Deltaproteobacteria bacterium]
MSLVKTSISIPEDVLQQAKEVSENFSALVTQALKEYLRKKAVKKAIDSFGAWEEREESSVEIVNKIRADKRGYAKRHH